MSLDSLYLLMKALSIVGQRTMDMHGQFEEPKCSARHFLYEDVGKFFFFSVKIVANCIKASQSFLRYHYLMVSFIVTL